MTQPVALSPIDRLDMVQTCVHIRTGELTPDEIDGLIELLRCVRGARQVWAEHVHLGHPHTDYWIPVLLRGLGINP